jgi:hypothetical protein
VSAPEQVAFDIDPAAGAAREERCRLATIAASGPLVLLLAPVFLPFDGDRSMLHHVHLDVIVVLLLVYSWPLLVGVVGLRSALARRPPNTLTFAVPAVLHALAAAFALLGTISAMTSRFARLEPIAVAFLGLPLLVLYLLIRGFRRRGFHRWAQLVAGMWLCHLAFVLMLVFDSGLGEAPALGMWLLLFACAAAAPAVVWSLLPQQRA